MSDLTALLLAGPLDAATLQARLDVSQATLSRLIQAEPQVLKTGRARATRYLLLRPLRGESAFPLWQVNAAGQAQSSGTLYTVWPVGHCVVESAAGGWQHFAGLPWYLSDMRPQGFLGRAWGRDCAQRLGLTEDIRQWGEDECLLALSHAGSDIPGNWLVGDDSYRRWLQASSPLALRQAEKAAAYPQLASRALAGEEPGSSAGGEQPKFTCYAGGEHGGAAHLLVKFTPARSNENSQRWRDLLYAEALALRLMNEYGLAAAEATLLDADNGQRFLEVVRFDRQGSRGRDDMVSLEAVQAEFTGSQRHWPEALAELVRQKRLGAADAERGTLQWAFGRLIANGDMHAGNLSFFLRDGRLTLTPAYDMLPMSFAPGATGQMRDSAPELKLDLSLNRACWQTAWQMADSYWQQLSEEAACSADFQRLAAEMREKLSELTGQIARMA